MNIEIITIFKKILRRFIRYLQIISSDKKYYRNGKVLDELFLKYKYEQSSVSLDIGSGPVPKNPFQSTTLYGADFRSNQDNNVVYSDLSLGKLPFDDKKFDLSQHLMC